jgi:hypothetical protein
VDVTVCKKEDLDGNKDTTTDRVDVVGWPVHLTIEGELADVQLTGDDGCYTWDHLMPGPRYDAHEDVLDGWFALTPTDRYFGPSSSGDSFRHTFVNSRLGHLEVTKIVLWNGATPDPDQAFEICITGPSYPDGDCKIFSEANGWTQTWHDLLPGVYIVTETDPGIQWEVTITGSPATVSPGDTAYVEVTNSLRYLGYTPGFWKNHTADSPSGHNAWQYTGYATGELLGDVFPDACLDDSPRGNNGEFAEFTLLEGLRLKGGRSTTGAKGILLRAGVAALLNASFGERMASLPDWIWAPFPETSDEVIAMVSAATCSDDRQEMLTLASYLDDLNNEGSEYFDWDWPLP